MVKAVPVESPQAMWKTLNNTFVVIMGVVPNIAPKPPGPAPDAPAPLHHPGNEKAHPEASAVGPSITPSIREFQPEQLRRLELFEAELSNDLVDPRDQFGLEKVPVGIRKFQVSESVAAAFDHYRSPSPVKGAHYRLRVAVYDSQQDAGRTVRYSPALFPVLHGAGV